MSSLIVPFEEEESGARIESESNFFYLLKLCFALISLPKNMGVHGYDDAKINMDLEAVIMKEKLINNLDFSTFKA